MDRRERDACVQFCVTLFFLSPFFRPLPLPCSAKPLAAWRPPCPAGRPATCRPRLGRLAGRRPSGRCVNEMTEREGSKSACSTTAAEVRWASRPPWRCTRARSVALVRQPTHSRPSLGASMEHARRSSRGNCVGAVEQAGRAADCALLSHPSHPLARPSLPFHAQAAPILIVLGAGAGLWYAKENGMLGDFVGVPGPVRVFWEGETPIQCSQCFPKQCLRRLVATSVGWGGGLALASPGEMDGLRSLTGGEDRKGKRSAPARRGSLERPFPPPFFRSLSLSLSSQPIPPQSTRHSRFLSLSDLHQARLRRRPGRHRRPPGRGRLR